MEGTPVFTPASPPRGRRNCAQLTEKKRGDGLECRFRSASRGSAKPAPIMLRHTNARAAPSPNPGWCGVSLRRVQLPNVVSSSESRSERPQPLRGPGRDADPVIEAYKRDIDRTLLRENLRRSPTERVANLIALQELAEEARRAGRAPLRSGRRLPAPRRPPAPAARWERASLGHPMERATRKG